MTFKEYALQDGNTLEATQRMLESRAVTEFPLNDQEILLRHLHKTARDQVADYQVRRDESPRSASRRPPEGTTTMTNTTLPSDFADLEPFADWALETEAERYAKRLASTMDELQAFYDAAFPRLEDAHRVLRQVRPRTRCPRTRRHLLWLCYSLVNVSFPVEVWRQPRVPDSGAASMDVVVEPAV